MDRGHDGLVARVCCALMVGYWVRVARVLSLRGSCKHRNTAACLNLPPLDHSSPRMWSLESKSPNNQYYLGGHFKVTIPLIIQCWNVFLNIGSHHHPPCSGPRVGASGVQGSWLRGWSDIIPAESSRSFNDALSSVGFSLSNYTLESIRLHRVQRKPTCHFMESENKIPPVCVHDLYCNGEYEAGYELILVMPQRYSYIRNSGNLGEKIKFALNNDLISRIQHKMESGSWANTQRNPEHKELTSAAHGRLWTGVLRNRCSGAKPSPHAVPSPLPHREIKVILCFLRVNMITWWRAMRVAPIQLLNYTFQISLLGARNYYEQPHD